MCKRISLLLLLFVFCLIVKAQEQPDIADSHIKLSKMLDNLYKYKNWDQTIILGDSLIKDGTDYFYLRVRIGVAYYEKKEYIKAIIHFEKALQFNSMDKFTLEYLYYSYINSGREQDARFLSAKFPQSLTDKINPEKNDLIHSVYIEGGPSFSNNESRNNTTDIDGEQDIYGMMDRNNDILYGHAGFKHNIGKYVSVYHGYSHINISKKLHIREQNTDSVEDYKLKQNEYYINSDIQLGKGFKITPAFHFIDVGSYSYYMKGKGNGRNAYQSVRKDSSFYNYLVSLAATKNILLFSFSLFGTFSNLNDKEQYQVGLSCVYYPLGNLDLYTNTTLTGHKEENNYKFIIDQIVGYKFLPKLWVEGYFTYGDQSNYNEKNGFIVYNIPDKIIYKTGISLLLLLNQNIELSLRHQYIYKENIYVTYDSFDTYITNNTNYQNNTIIGGLKWKL